MLKSKIAYLRYILVATFIGIAATSHALSTNYYATSSLLSSGKWVKIRVKNNTIYQLTYSQLREMGFSDPTKVAVYGYGGSRLTDNKFTTLPYDDIKQTATYHTTDGRILFYGEGDFSYKLTTVANFTSMRNVYDQYGYYFLSDCQTPTDAEQVKWSEGSDSKDFHYDVTVIENEIQNPGQGGAIFHDRVLSPGDSQAFDFKLTDFETDEDGYLLMKVAALSSGKTPFNVGLSEGISVDSPINLTVSSITSSSKLFRSQTLTKAINSEEENTNATITIGLPQSSTPDYAAVDYVCLIYPRKTRVNGNSILTMQYSAVTAGQNFSIADADKDLVVWNIDDAADVQPYQTHYSPNSRTIECSFDKDYTTDGCRVIAFNPNSTFTSPTVIGDIANQNIHADATPDMVIITTQALYDLAEELADIHRTAQGMTVNVYTQQQIYNEFSSGCRSAMAYRRLAKMFYDRDSNKFKNLLLYGPSHWDNRALTIPDRDLLVCYEAELESLANDENTNFVFDNYFGMLNDNYVPTNIQRQEVNIAVGRIATENAMRAKNYNQKVLDYIVNPPSPKAIATAVYSSDDNNALSHITQAEAAISSMASLYPAMTFIKAHNLLYPWNNEDAVMARGIIANGFKSGAGYFGYSGHGNSTSITGEDIWSNTAIMSTDYKIPTFVMLASCHTFSFDRMDNGMGEMFLGKRNGGAIAVVAASRYVYLEYNQQLNLAIARQYASINENSTVGSIYLNARKYLLSLGAENGAMINTACYNLGGDPAVPIIGPKYAVKISEINGKTVNEGDSTTVSVKAHTAVKISGYIADKVSGKANTDFTGDVVLNIYDAPRTLTTLLRTSGDGTTAKDVELNFDLLAMTTAKVSNGKFTATIYLPTPAKYDDLNRITAFATSSNDSSQYGAGECTAMTINSTDSDDTIASDAPQIVDVYLDDASFNDNDCISSNFTYHAIVNPSEVGLNLSQGLIGASTRLTLDGSKSYTNISSYFTLNNDGTADLSVPFSDVPLGRHILTLSVANTAGQRSQRAIEFNVVRPSVSAELNIDNVVARKSATIDVTHTFSSTPEYHLIIQADNGKTIINRSNCSMPFTWNLQDQNGTPVTDGRYRAYVLLSDDSNYTSTQTQDIIVIRE
jgi:hypothetical protein